MKRQNEKCNLRPGEGGGAGFGESETADVDADAVEEEEEGEEEEAGSKFSVAAGSAFPCPGETMKECQISKSLADQLKLILSRTWLLPPGGHL